MVVNNNYENDQDPIEKELANEKSHDIIYSIDSWSSYSSTYHPSHILVDNPKDQGSRWSSINNTNEQYIIIKLNQLSIVIHKQNSICLILNLGKRNYFWKIS